VLKKKLALIAALAVIGLSALAQSLNPEFVTDRESSFGYGVNSDENGIFKVPQHSRPLFDSIRRHGHVSYGEAQPDLRVDANSPATTGGGSLGYNQMLLID
jgi:hypothetical protein